MTYVDSLINLGKYNFEQGREQQASILLLMAEPVAFELDNADQLIKIYSLLASIYESQQDYQKSSEYYKKLIEINDRKHFENVDEGYDTSEVIPLNLHEKRLHELQLKKRDDLITFLITLTSLIFLLIIFIIYYSRNKKQELENIIEEQTRSLKKKNVELQHEMDKKLQSEEKFKALFNESTQSIFVHDIHTMAILDVNDMACLEYGFTKDEMLKMSISDLSSSSMFSSDSPQVKEIINQLLQGKIIQKEWQAKRKDGTLFWQDIYARITQLDNNDRLLVFARNIDDKKKIREKLEESEDLLRSIIYNLPITCYAYDKNGRISHQSEMSKKRWGNMIGKTIDDIKIPDELKDKWKNWKNRVYKGESISSEYELSDQDEVLYFKSKIIPLMKDDSVIGILGVDIDITELINNEKKLLALKDDLEDMVEVEIEKRKEQQAMLIQKSKLESLGHLAAGIAHEINQPLGLISFAIENIAEKIKYKQDIRVEYLREKINKLFSYTDRIHQIIDHIGTFSRDQKDITYDEVQINKVVEAAISMVRKLYEKHDIHFQITLEDDLPPILGNQYKLEQVVLNFLSNAYEAIKEKFEQDTEEQKLIKIDTYQKKQNICLRITDNGIGIHQKDIEHIFEPFFTKRSSGKGTGLGLSISYGILEEMGAEISVESKQEIFTTFIIQFKPFIQ